MAPRLDWKRRLRESRLYPVIAPRLAAPARARGRRRFEAALRSSDTFLVGHPKSGNTWLAYVLAVLREPESGPRVTLANVGAHVPVVHGREWTIARHAGLPDPRIFRNEWPQFQEAYPRTIYLVRDPRAVLVSQYHMYRVTFPHDSAVRLDAFVDEYLEHGCIRRWEPKLVRWDLQVDTWMRRAEASEDVLLVRYEDMVEDLRREVERVARFVGLRCTRERLELAVERGRFDVMRRDEDEHGAEAYPGEKRGRGRFVRRGEIAGWRTEMSGDVAAKIERAFAGGMQALGYAG